MFLLNHDGLHKTTINMKWVGKENQTHCAYKELWQKQLGEVLTLICVIFDVGTEQSATYHSNSNLYY